MVMTGHNFANVAINHLHLTMKVSLPSVYMMIFGENIPYKLLENLGL